MTTALGIVPIAYSILGLSQAWMSRRGFMHGCLRVKMPNGPEIPPELAVMTLVELRLIPMKGSGLRGFS